MHRLSAGHRPAAIFACVRATVLLFIAAVATASASNLDDAMRRPDGAGVKCAKNDPAPLCVEGRAAVYDKGLLLVCRGVLADDPDLRVLCDRWAIKLGEPTGSNGVLSARAVILARGFLEKCRNDPDSDMRGACERFAAATIGSVPARQMTPPASDPDAISMCPKPYHMTERDGCQ